ncbi:MAG: hypothetical protein A2161_08615 [Candidatus Schekmanbacteria bacterium RBG_13_48_7]|uniref:DUF1207 domain-containing protein n=1 Tax=Candidatus Schekmanbacteria bacterium RBG_13_48_7 TaxID=1817878 RepID=A0A1F7RVT8_9BACT|nr:MAG: hypothetical protein A2161_08615 [Candidatus Schekmanbacteria bacterium RBG_13_48_7]
MKSNSILNINTILNKPVVNYKLILFLSSIAWILTNVYLPAYSQSSYFDYDTQLSKKIDLWLLNRYRIGSDEISVDVDNGTVNLKYDPAFEDKLEEIISQIKTFPGVINVSSGLIVRKTAVGISDSIPDIQPVAARIKPWLDFVQPPSAKNYILLPRGNFFVPVFANPKEPVSHAIWQSYDTKYGKFNMASVSFGEDFGIVRCLNQKEGYDWQLSLNGAVFTLFMFDSQEGNLMNADYIIGVPFSLKKYPWSFRARLYHQSSHLGHEFKFNDHPDPFENSQKFSYEALELLGSAEWNHVRFILGSSVIISSTPVLSRGIFQAGIDYNSPPLQMKTARLFAGIYAEYWDETSSSVNFNVKAGIEFHSPDENGRAFKILIEYHDGTSPNGLYYLNLEVKYIGFGFSLDF